MTTARFYGLFESEADVLKEFDIESVGGRILYASYVDEDYEGDALVVFESESGEILFVEGGHCSCFGLEDLWKPEPISKVDLVRSAIESNIWRRAWGDLLRTLHPLWPSVFEEYSVELDRRMERGGDVYAERAAEALRQMKDEP